MKDKPSGTTSAAGSPRGNHAHTITGKVRNASAPWSGDSGSHVSVEVEHGRAAPKPKAGKGEMAMPSSGGGKKHSTFHMPADLAMHYPVGQRVSVTIAHAAPHPGVGGPAAGAEPPDVSVTQKGKHTAKAMGGRVLALAKGAKALSGAMRDNG